MSNLREEKRLWIKGYKMIACLDEVGRGPLAGPVTACAVVILKKKSDFNISKELKEVKDSKTMDAKKREELFLLFKNHPQIEWGIGRVSERIIDRVNIFEASKLAMERAVNNLRKKINRKIDFLLLDGNFTINLDLPQKPIIKADQKVFSVSAASIIAKVTRDRTMERLHKKYPKYGFDIHKGYPTELHCKLLFKYGPCKIHRKTFVPVRDLIKE